MKAKELIDKLTELTKRYGSHQEVEIKCKLDDGLNYYIEIQDVDIDVEVQEIIIAGELI